jgi:hypothetical protein
MISSVGIKWIIGASLIAGIFYAGYHTGAGKVITTTERIKGETEIVYKDRIVTVTKTVQPDGTVTETTKTEDSSKTEKTKTEANKVAVAAARMKYSLGLFTMPKVIRGGGEIKRVSLLPGVSAGYNLGNEVWLKLGYVPADSIGVIGIEIHF